MCRLYTDYIKNIDKESKIDYYIIVSRIKPDGFDNKGRNYIWIPSLAPSYELLGLWKKSMISWLEFESRYQREVIKHISTMKALISKIKSTPSIRFHLCCYEYKPILCHRLILSEMMLKIDSELECEEFDLRKEVVGNELF